MAASPVSAPSSPNSAPEGLNLGFLPTSIGLHGLIGLFGTSDQKVMTPHEDLKQAGREILTWGKYAGRTFAEAYVDTCHFQFLDAVNKEKKLKGNQSAYVRWGRLVCAG